MYEHRCMNKLFNDNSCYKGWLPTLYMNIQGWFRVLRHYYQKYCEILEEVERFKPELMLLCFKMCPVSG